MSNIIEKYRELRDLSKLLLETAQSRDWDRTSDLERERTILLQNIGVLPELDEQEKREVAQLIEETLQYDAQSTPLIRKEMADLRELLASAVNERKLGASYL